MSKHFKFAIALAVYATIIAAPVNVSALTAEQISQRPVFIATQNWPGNLTLVPSMEWPTFLSVANLTDTYTTDETFVGYFDSNKCYLYNFGPTIDDRYFYPVRVNADRNCVAAGEWSGNFLNWAATQTMDPFRKALTGGTRAIDEVGRTVLVKTRHSGQGDTNIFPDRNLSGAALVEGATPFTGVNNFRTKLFRGSTGFGTRMHFRLDGNVDGNSATEFDPAQHPDAEDPSNTRYSVEIRVKVCVPGLLEDNCVRYGSGNYKPEGLIQANANDLRYSIFGYLNEDNIRRDGAPLRARKKYVGPTIPGVGINPNAEWSASTGIQVKNPDPDDAKATSDEFGITIERSGVINYLNLAGMLDSPRSNLNSKDPVSEMYYAAVRYMRGLSNVSTYTDMSGYTDDQKRAMADSFPVISDWRQLDDDGNATHDPILSVCQTNVALGIGDVYTHRDKNLPGNSATLRIDEPTMPSEVIADTWVNVVDATNRVGQLEGIGNIGNSQLASGLRNAAYIAGLAYWANTQDMRPDNGDDETKVTMSTYWVDVLEAESLEGMARNQYALAAKYGGADLPDDFDPMSDSLPLDSWHTNGETLSPFGRGNGDPDFLRPDNYYVAGEAAQMVDGLTQAFEDIIEEVTGLVTAASTTSRRVESDTLILLGEFETENWSGNIRALSPEDQSLRWSASDEFTSSFSKIFTSDPSSATPGVSFSTGLSGAPKTRIESTLPTDKSLNELISYISGNQTLDTSDDAWRDRGPHTLGSIINSNLVLSRPSNEGWARVPSPDGAGQAYIDYIDGPKATRGNWVFVGANDGMLHAFNATTGARAFSYLPYSVLNKLHQLSDPEYDHAFFVDGGISVTDAYINGGWKTILVGSLGAGGRGVFALDVTDPANFAASDVLWEYSGDAEQDNDLGFTFGQPVITRLEKNNKWAAVFGNGYGAPNGGAHLYFVDLETGDLLSGDSGKITLDDAPGNGLSGPSIWLDTTTRLFASRIYAGDLNGNLWRVDLDGNTPSKFADFSTDGLLFSEPNNRPITVAPTLAASPVGGLGVFFGTGRLVSDLDRSGNDVDRFYSLVDKNTAVASTGNTAPEELTLADGSEGKRSISGDVSGDRGWYIDLTTTTGTGNNAVVNQQGERVLDKAAVRFGRVLFSTFEPAGGTCDASQGTQRLYVLDAVSGTGSVGGANTGVASLTVGVGAPIQISPIVGQPPGRNPTTDGGDPFNPPDDPDLLPTPDDTFVGERSEWCSPIGYIDPNTGEFVAFGTLCDGRQVWREVR